MRKAIHRLTLALSLLLSSSGRRPDVPATAYDGRLKVTPRPFEMASAAADRYRGGEIVTKGWEERSAQASFREDMSDQFTKDLAEDRSYEEPENADGEFDIEN